ncbi:MAG TPA: M15 family metallopeptidase [Actinomycetales bacterium]|nr:M15 family metallopeptidase [Actinomycetales bacterium]
MPTSRVDEMRTADLIVDETAEPKAAHLEPVDIASMTRREYRAWLAAKEALEAAATAETTPAEHLPAEAVPAETLPVEVFETHLPSEPVPPPAPAPLAPLPSRRELRNQRAHLVAREAAEVRRARVTALTTHLPRVGIVGALGLATVVAPMVGNNIADADNAKATAAANPGADDQPPTPSASPSRAALLAASDFRVIPRSDAQAAALRVSSQPLTAEQLAASRQAAERASRDLERPVLPGCDGEVSDFNAANGYIDKADMCELWAGGHYLRADAAIALAELNVAYRKQFGTSLSITDSYRSYRQQVSVRARKPGLAARPGTSQHGWGLAVDLAGGVQNADVHYRWLRAHAPQFGWDNPAWARSGGSGPYEPWHWEYVAGQSKR